MGNCTSINETFSIEFNGLAFDNKRISPFALAQSFLALDGLTHEVAKSVYGKNAESEICVHGGCRQGSFILELTARCKDDPSALRDTASATTVGGGVVATIMAVIKLGKFVFGKKAITDSASPSSPKGDVMVTNELGQCMVFNANVVNIYNTNRTRSQLSRLTQTLDQNGADSIRLYTEDDDPTEEVITKEERNYFRHAEGIVLTDNAIEVILEVIGPMTNASSKGWRFSEGADGVEFTATVEDESFLNEVRERKVKFENGTAIRAIMRTVQRKNIRTVTDRTIVEVKEVFPPEENVF